MSDREEPCDEFDDVTRRTRRRGHLDDDPSRLDDRDRRCRRVYAELLERVGEGAPQPRLERHAPGWSSCSAIRSAAYPIIHVTGTNGKTSTSRIDREHPARLRAAHRAVHEPAPRALQRAHRDRRRADLRPRRSPTNWDEIAPVRRAVDAELDRRRRARRSPSSRRSPCSPSPRSPTRPSTSPCSRSAWAASGIRRTSPTAQVAVFAPDRPRPHAATRLDDRRDRAHQGGHHQARAPPSSRRAQAPEALAELERAAELTESTLAVEGDEFALDVAPPSRSAASSSRCAASPATYDDLYLPLFGDHQAHNAAARDRGRRVVPRRGHPAARRRRARRGPRDGRPRPAACSSSASSRPCSWMPHTTRTAPRALAAALAHLLRLRRVRRRARRSRRQGCRGHRRRRSRPVAARFTVTQSHVGARGRRRRPRGTRRRSRGPGLDRAVRLPRDSRSRMPAPGPPSAAASRGRRHRLDHPRRRGDRARRTTEGWKR